MKTAVGFKCLALMSLLFVCGCGGLEIALGTRTALAKIPVDSAEVSMPSGPALAPGEKSPLVVVFQDTNGKTWMTEGAGKGRIEWRDIAVQTTIVSWNKKGTLRAPHDARLTDGKVGHVAVTVPSHPSLHVEMDIPFRYDYAFAATYAGRKGSDGSNGTDGSSGSNGSVGSFDPNNPSPGGNGSDGSNGSDGGGGGNGDNGPDVQVHLTLRPGPHPLLQAGVIAPGHREHFYLVDPQGGSLSISSNGGAGGSGGKGGRGGSGGSGGAGIPPGSSGHDGQSGSNGSDGRAGSGGQITVIYDPTAQPFLSAIGIYHSDRKPIFRQEHVPPLW